MKSWVLSGIFYTKAMIFLTKDMTKGTEWKLILFFTLPLMAGNLLQQIYSLADSLVAGNMVSETAISAIGVVFPVTYLLLAVATGLSNGCGVIVAQYFGAKDIPNVRRAVSTALITTLGASVLVTILGYALTTPVLVGVLNTPDSILPEAETYMHIYCLGLIFQFAYNAIASVLRALGDSKATLYFLLVAAVMNVVLDIALAPFFGVAGIAWATVTAQAASAVVSLIYMFKRISFLRYAKGEFTFEKDMFQLSMRLGIPTVIQQCCVGLGMVLMQRLINSFGEDAISATTAAMRVESFVMVPIMMFFQGLANFTGQNIGAGKLDRVKRGYHQTLIMAVICCAIIITVILVFCTQIIACFGLNEAACELGAQYLRCLVAFFIIFCMMYITNGVLQGAGDVMYPTIASMFSLAVRVISANLMAAFTPIGYGSVYFAVPIGWAVGLAIVFTRYLTGKWKEKALV